MIVYALKMCTFDKYFLILGLLNLNSFSIRNV